MKYISKILVFTLAIALISACTKVIDVEVGDTELNYVIEAKLIGETDEFYVSVSKTANYFTNNAPVRINTAEVTLYEGESSEGITIPFIEDGYYGLAYTPALNQEYTLQVEIDGTTYEAKSYLNPPIQMDSIYSAEPTFNPFGEGDELDVFYIFDDPANIDNYYQAKYFFHGEEMDPRENLYVFNDKFFDGTTYTDYIGYDFEPGDTVSVELKHLDVEAYNYLFALESLFVGGGGAPAAPGNPPSNWTGGALGYFSAYSSHTLTVVVTE